MLGMLDWGNFATASTHLPDLHNTITTASMEVVTDVLCESAQILRKVYKDLDQFIDESGVIDLNVSFDGSWMTRGHKSLYGIGCVVEVVTGLVIDFAVLSLYCQSCSYASKRHGGQNTTGFQQWHEQHTDYKLPWLLGWHGDDSCRDFVGAFCRVPSFPIYDDTVGW